MGIAEPRSMRLSELLADSRQRTRGQVRESTLVERDIAMKHLMEAIGDINVQEVKHRHGELFIQFYLDRGNSTAMTNEMVTSLKRLFQLAVIRGQLAPNPFRYIQRMKVPARPMRVFGDDECSRLLAAARESGRVDAPDLESLIIVALCTAMRRGELLNTTWADIDFDKLTISVSPKQNTAYTWEWRIKDSEHRTLPLTREVADLLMARRTTRTTAHPYVFIIPPRYQAIQACRDAGAWSLRDSRRPVNNFNRGFDTILKRAGIEGVSFTTCGGPAWADGLRMG